MKLPNWFLRLGEALMESEAPPRRWTPPLTDEEREAVEHFAWEFKGPRAVKLRGLLERLK